MSTQLRSSGGVAVVHHEPRRQAVVGGHVAAHVDQVQSAAGPQDTKNLRRRLRHWTRRSGLGPPSPAACRDNLFPNRIQGVNPWCPSGVSVNTCSRRRAPSGIRSLPAWAFPSSPSSSRTGGRPRPSSWSLPRCAFPSCCNGGGGSRLQPIARNSIAQRSRARAGCSRA